MIAEPILNAILNLFAKAAFSLSSEEQQRVHKKVLSYLKKHLGLVDVSTYIGLYQELVELHLGMGEEAESVLKSAEGIATELKTLLQESEKYVTIGYFAELTTITEATLVQQIVHLLGRTFTVEEKFTSQIILFLKNAYSPQKENNNSEIKLLMKNQLAVMRSPIAKLLFISPTAIATAPIENINNTSSFRIDGQHLEYGGCYSFRPGQVLLDKHRNALYFDNLISEFTDEKNKSGANANVALTVTFQAINVNYLFPGSKHGLHDFSCNEKGGKMIGIMGASGAGKSTLLSILNGTLKANSGEILINGHSNKSDLCDGIIGNIPQDDLLFEDLTVFENLYYAARLCMSNLSDDELKVKVNSLLTELGQLQVQHLKVGSPLDKTISGGQRKRLNIALELIRGPSILFVDEPTSGLSSNDAENVMGLLKAQTACNKLVVVVIHQPSSKIFRMFDSLWILDNGGQFIFNGPPLEALVYFRSRADIPGAEEAICENCGHTSPEQIFEIIEDKTIDQNCQLTHTRKISPEKWREIYLQYQSKSETSIPTSEKHITKKHIHRPSLWGQFKVFFTRDIVARKANKEYLLITFLEPIILAVLIALICRGVNSTGFSYTFYDNKNIHIFFFMSVMVAIFLGLSVSAEEICRDRKILKRESFLNLSWWSYINSKIFYLSLISAIQMFLYVIISNSIIEIKDFNIKSWFVLFLCGLSSAVLGLNISATFRSPITIYILIPLILIPQMILSGAVIKYESLIAKNSLKRDVPFYTNIFFSRFAYEGLIVEQYVSNKYMKDLIESDALIKQAEYELDNYIPEVQSLNKSLILLFENKNPSLSKNISLLKNEIKKIESNSKIIFSNKNFMNIDSSNFNLSFVEQIDDYLLNYRKTVFEKRKEASAQKREIENEMNDESEVLKKRYSNQLIQRLVLNIDELQPVMVTNNGIYQNILPIYLIPESPYGNAHFMASKKKLGNLIFNTYTFNMLALFTFSLLLYIFLCFRRRSLSKN
ncbi:MAG: ATP-binding cassette domain-containing protein [Oligoflexia bacterium]|nr:ATP-binding cassette domain-containing protein [Oligoflexia bacterium]